MAVADLRSQAVRRTPDQLLDHVASFELDLKFSASVDVLTDINVNIVKGKTVAVVGESGSGKSTLARVITGLLPPSQGSVKFHGRELTAALKDRPKRDLQSIQMIFRGGEQFLGS